MTKIDEMRAAARERAAALPRAQLDERTLAVLDRFESAKHDPEFGDSRGVVRRTPEFERIDRLPRLAPWEADARLAADVFDMTEDLRSAGGTMTLRPIQAAALFQLEQVGGLFANIGVGEGKTLITYLAGAVLGVSRVVVLVPAKLREKTRRDFASLSEHWAVDLEIKIVSYELLGRSQAAKVLDDFRPELIIGDECQALRNLQAARTRRVIRYFRENPSTAAVMLSGTVTHRSIRDFHHLIALCVGTDGMPLPVTQSELSVWSRVVDEGVEQRARPGALKAWIDGAATLAAARRAVGDRIFSTPGVIQTRASTVRTPILIDFFDPKLTDEQRAALRTLEKDKIDPDGEPCTPADVARHTKTIVQGFRYVYRPPPPEDWLLARRRWKRFVRDILDVEDPRFDSELQVAQACERDVLERGFFDEWKAVKKTYTVPPVADWITLDVLAQIIDVTPDEAIVWVENVATGEALHEMTGWPYYANQGLDDAGNFIDDDEGGRPIIASIGANAEGRNLQRWSSNVVVSPPSSGKTWEQLIGRTHRPGQTGDYVDFLVVLGRYRIAESFRQAVADAAYLQEVTGQLQKLLLADMTRDFSS